MFGLESKASFGLALVAVAGFAGWGGTPGSSRHSSRLATAQESQEFRWSGTIQPGSTLEIKGVNGDVKAEGGSGTQAEILATKTGKDDDPSEVSIELVEHSDGVTVCAVYPQSSGKKPFVCEPGNDGKIGSHENDVVVNFTVRVPRGVNLTAETVNGAVEARSIDGDVRARTVNGSVQVTATGAAEGQTVNGSVTISMGRAEGALNFQTVNGSITVELPDGVGAQVSASTVNGEITTDFPITVQGRFGMRHAQGRIGAGGADLSLETVNGSITLKRASG